MGSSSVRVSSHLLARLHEAKPPGASLADVIETALEHAGGPQAVRNTMEAENRQARIQARTARLRSLGHPSVVLPPGEQLSLAEGIRRKTQAERTRGDRSKDPRTGILVLASEPSNANDSDDGSTPSTGRLGARRGGE